MAQPSHRRADQGVNLGSGQAHGPAHSATGPPFGIGRPAGRADKQCRVRPGGLGQVLDGHADPALTFDQQHVAGLQARHEKVWIGRRGHAMHMVGPTEVAAQSFSTAARDAVQDVSHGVTLSKRR
ncbi:hypothetical protein G6F32_013785 [Rhizopus arrhizus]|nr:hypothetical protein G6F32_013785 [Rhizopus arrhizus]